ncbi:pseudouridine-5'-phosphate glycosidase [Pacificispira sp.]|uniref:pseudouridine-5'-phosphate glycosidase n=1 Tax=Pacificispira sp. TaxID=2888761 RepID=UPI003BAD761F
MRDLISLSGPVRNALRDGAPVVALESTVIAHGLPHPDNLEAAAAMEDAVRQAGAIPATIAVLDGRIRIGLSEEDRANLADPDAAVAKLSRRDLAACLTLNGTGATTVSATMICAHAAGIRVFATGGIGGVHRGAENSMDVSADLLELARTPVLTVSSGAKSILDLPRTMEVLETQGVPVLGYRTDRLPAFHSRDSGLPLDAALEGPQAAARVARAHWALGLGGLLICNPVPDEAAIPADEVAAWVDAALAAAEQDGIAGKEVTPYLLRHIANVSGGRSLAANKALLIDNARVGGEIAVALAEGVS